MRTKKFLMKSSMTSGRRVTFPGAACALDALLPAAAAAAPLLRSCDA
jgi:hypothetical protein